MRFLMDAAEAITTSLADQRGRGLLMAVVVLLLVAAFLVDRLLLKAIRNSLEAIRAETHEMRSDVRAARQDSKAAKRDSGETRRLFEEMGVQLAKVQTSIERIPAVITAEIIKAWESRAN